MELNSSIAYVKSPFMQVIRGSDSVIIWHSLFGYPKIISIETFEFIESFSEPTIICSQPDNELTNEDWDAIKELLQCYFFVPENFDDRAFLKKKMMERETEIVSGSLINLECRRIPCSQGKNYFEN